jgi:uncharacterized protein YdhG (YjbR/CyaY superfamily)
MTVTQYIAAAPKEAQQMLKQLRVAIRSTAPQAKEKISYGIPFYEYKSPGYRGRLAYFAAFKNHVSVFAWGHLVDTIPGLKKYKASKSAIHFPLGTKIPVALVKRVVRARMREIDRVLGSRRTSQ